MATVATLQNRVSRVSTEFASLDAAITALGASSAVLTLVPGDTKTLTGNVTVPENVTLSGQMGVIATNGFTLTVNGKITAGPWQVFDTSGSGAVVLGGDVDEVWVEWWGVNRDGTTDDNDAFQAGIAAAAGRRTKMLGGTYFVDNSGADLKSPTIHDGVDVHLACIGGVATLKAHFIELPTVSGVPATSSKITRNVLTVENADNVVLENVLLDGGDDLVGSTSAEDDIDQTYRASMLEIRSCERVVLRNVRTQRARVVTSPVNHGTGGEDVIETYRSGPVFIRDCTHVVGTDCGFGDDHRGEGWQVLNCDVVDFDQFHSAAPNVWTPLNVRGTGSVIRINAIVENNDGSAIGVGGQDADINVKLTAYNSGGVNVARYLASDVRGFKTCTVEVNGSGLQDSSHGFGVKLEPTSLVRSFSGATATYPYGALTVRGAVDGCLFGVVARHCESVDVDMVVHDAVDASAAHAGAHSTYAGAGMFIQQCGTVRLRGKVRGDRQLTVSSTAYDPEYGWLVLDCEHVDADVMVRGGAFNGPRGNVGACAVSTIDGEATNGDRHFKTLKVGGTLIECEGYFGETTEKLNSITFKPDFLRHLDADGDADLVGTDNLTLNVYQVLPMQRTAYSLSGASQALAAGTASRPTLDTLAAGFLADLYTTERALRPRQRGSFLVNARVRLNTVPSGSTVQMEIRKNGTLERFPLQQFVNGAAASTVSMGGTWIVDMNGTTDYVNLYVTCSIVGATIGDAYIECVPVGGMY